MEKLTCRSLLQQLGLEFIESGLPLPCVLVSGSTGLFQAAGCTDLSLHAGNTFPAPGCCFHRSRGGPRYAWKKSCSLLLQPPIIPIVSLSPAWLYFFSVY